MSARIGAWRRLHPAVRAVIVLVVLLMPRGILGVLQQRYHLSRSL